MQRIVVTGLGAITPIGNDVPTYWRNLVNGVSGVDAIKGFDPGALDVRIAAEVKGFDPKQYIDAKKARRMDRFSQFAVAAAGEALKDAGIEKFKFGRSLVTPAILVDELGIRELGLRILVKHL